MFDSFCAGDGASTLDVIPLPFGDAAHEEDEYGEGVTIPDMEEVGESVREIQVCKFKDLFVQG